MALHQISGTHFVVPPVVHHKLRTAAFLCYATFTARTYGPSGRSACTTEGTCCTAHLCFGSHPKVALFHVIQCLGEEVFLGIKCGVFFPQDPKKLLLCCRWCNCNKLSFTSQKMSLAKLWQLVSLLAAGRWGIQSSLLALKPFCVSGSSGPSRSR